MHEAAGEGDGGPFARELFEPLSPWCPGVLYLGLLSSCAFSRDSSMIQVYSGHIGYLGLY